MEIDTEAIAHCLNQSLTFDGIIAKVSVKNDCLKIALESVAVTKKDQLLPVIMREIANFKLTSIKTVKIYGKQIKTFDPNWYHNFDLQPENSSDYSKSSKFKNHRKKSNYQVDISKIKVPQAEFEVALKQCSKTANSAYNISLKYVKKTEEIIKVLNYDTRDISNKLLNQKDVDRFEFIDVLKKIQLYIKTFQTSS